MKEILKSRKVIYAICTVVLTAVAEHVPGIDPDIAVYILSIGIALITGHTVTDIAAIAKIAKKDS